MEIENDKSEASEIVFTEDELEDLGDLYVAVEKSRMEVAKYAYYYIRRAQSGYEPLELLKEDFRGHM